MITSLPSGPGCQERAYYCIRVATTDGNYNISAREKESNNRIYSKNLGDVKFKKVRLFLLLMAVVLGLYTQQAYIGEMARCPLLTILGL